MTDQELTKALEAAVPLHVMELRALPWVELQRMAQEAGQTIAEHGDLILFRSKKRGETAKAFNALARALAILSFVPGGVRFLELHFENATEPVETLTGFEPPVEP